MNLAHKRLLVVDDEANFAAFVRDAASTLGCTVDVAESSREAMDVYARAAPDVIVLDIVMPEMDGVELMRWLAAQGCNAQIVLVTGFNPHYAEMAERLSTALGLAPPVVLAKPVRLVTLLNTLEPLLGAA